MGHPSPDARSSYEAGQLSIALEALRGSDSPGSEDRLLEAIVAFDLGRATEAIDLLDRLADELVEPIHLRYHVELARFSRTAPFFAPAQTTSNLARLRQLATTIGEPEAVSGLHMAVAKLETLRGSTESATSHLDIARRISEREPLPHLLRSITLIQASVDTAVGNLRRATLTNSAALEVAKRDGATMPLVGLLANGGQLALWAGNAAQARKHLAEAVALGAEFMFLSLGARDSLAALALFEGDLPAARQHIDECQALIATHQVPARSWYDLTHQLTRCLYFGMREEWQAIINCVNDAGPELARRQLRTWRASLLAARARAEARLGRHDAADTSLLAAMRVCPGGAIDPLISIETATGTCLALRGDTNQAHRHFDRALRACDAIDHRFQHWLVERERGSLPTLPLPAHAPALPERRRQADADDTALLLGDLSALLQSGHSLELLAQRVTSILEATPLRSRVTVSRAPATGDSAMPSVSWDFRGSHGCRIDLTSTDATISIDIRQLASLEEIAIVKNLTDILAAAVDMDDDAEHQLWPTAEPSTVEDAVFWSPRMQELLRVAQRLASTDLPILITGETGTGKDVFARMIHDHSRVKRGPFVPFNASAIPRDLVESQMFGHRRGAFTGAHEASPGVIRSADQGTLLLDEIGDLDLAVQPKLLRFLESGEVHPVGDAKPHLVRVRVVAATNARLETLVAEGRFRSDLFYRLRVATLSLPPLRERKDEIPALTAFFLRKATGDLGRSQITLGDDVVAALLLYDWPGNLRQLTNELRRMVALAEDGTTLRATDLSPDVSGPWFAARPHAARDGGKGVVVSLDQPLELALADVERAFIERAMAQSQGRVSDAAQLLGISRKGLFLKRKKLGLD